MALALKTDVFDWLQKWFVSVCDGTWEHEHGISIGTLDNPGWSIDIVLKDTPLEKLEFQSLKIERAEHDWLHCWTEVEEHNPLFRIACGPLNMREALEVFRNWVFKERRKGSVKGGKGQPR